jgi:hypothetical protein
MVPAVALPALPLVRLRASRTDLLRTLLERQPAFVHATPAAAVVTGDRGVTSYRSAPGSFFLQVHWRWSGEAWDEREVVVVPGAVVALRLVLDDVDPAAITRALDLVPTRAFGKRANGGRGGAGHDEGLWIHEVWPHGFQFAEEKVAELVALLRARPRLREVLAARGVTWAGITVKLRGCVERAGGFALEPTLVADLAGLSLALDLELGVD